MCRCRTQQANTSYIYEKVYYWRQPRLIDIRWLSARARIAYAHTLIQKRDCMHFLQLATYIFVYVCVCVCVRVRRSFVSGNIECVVLQI